MPFTYISVGTPTAPPVRDGLKLRLARPLRLAPGFSIWLSGSAYQQYILDPQTGIAKNVTDWPVRPW